MTAGIEQINGQAAFAAAREGGWHRLGQVFTEADALTVDQAMEAALLKGWNVRKLAAFAEEALITPDGVETIRIPGRERYFTVRTNPVTGKPEFLGDVGKRYTILQNEDHVEFLSLLADMSGAWIDTAGSLFGGTRVFVSMKLPQSIQVGGVDQTDLYLIGLNSFDGTSGFDICLSAIRPVCFNTVTAAFRGAKHKYSVRHTSNARGRVQDARESLQMSFTYAERYQAEAEALLGRTMKDAEFDAFLDSLFDVREEAEVSTRKANQIQQVRDLWNSSPTLLGTKGTRYGAFQAVTEYTTHFAAAHGKTTLDQAFNRSQRDVLDDSTRTKAWGLLATV